MSILLNLLTAAVGLAAHLIPLLGAPVLFFIVRGQ